MMHKIFTALLLPFLCGFLPLPAMAQAADSARDEVTATTLSGTGSAPQSPGSDEQLPTGLNGVRMTYEAIRKDVRGLQGQVVKSTNTPATMTMSALREQQLAWRSKVESISVEFDWTMTRSALTPYDQQKLKAGKLIPENYAFRYRLALKGDKRYSEFRDETPPAEDADPVEVRSSYVEAFNGAEARSYRPSRAVGFIRPTVTQDHEGHGIWYFDAISIPVGPNAERLRNSEWYVPVALDSADYEVLPLQEIVDGRLCHVVTSGYDTIWIDVEHGGYLPRRLIFHRTSRDDPGCIWYLYINRQAEEAYDDVWLPHECVRVDFATEANSQAKRGSLASVNRAVVAPGGLTVNSVPDELFDLPFPPGTEVIDVAEGRAYIMPHGEEMMEAAIKEARQIVDGRIAQPRDPIADVSNRSPRRWLLIANVLLVLGIVCLVAIRTWRLRSASSDAHD